MRPYIPQNFNYNIPATPTLSPEEIEMQRMREMEAQAQPKAAPQSYFAPANIQPVDLPPQAGYGKGFGGFITSPEISQGLIGAGRAIMDSGYKGNIAEGIFGFNEGMQKAKQQRLENALKNLSARSMLAGGATGILMNRLKSENPNLTDKEALTIARSTLPNQGLEYTPQGVRPIPGYVNSKAQAEGMVAGAKQTAQNASDLTYKPIIAQQTDLAKTDAERQANLSKAQGALKQFEIKVNNVNNTIDKALNLADSKFATGYGNFLGALPNTDARELNNYLDTIKANIGFDQLQSMRDASPTGGALGSVTENENKLLQAVNGALDPKASKQLKENLTIIKDLYPQVLEEKQRAFNQDYGSRNRTINLGTPNQNPQNNAPKNPSRPPLNEIFK